MLETLVLLSALACPQEPAKTFWAFQKPREVAAPRTKDRGWPRSDLDRFVLAALEKKGLEVNADADAVTWIRRVTFDLTGLPPQPDDIVAFVADESQDARAKVVDRLLASPQFGERWGRHWLDVVRYAESTGRTRNFPFPVAWRYRDYVIDAFNADKPYDEFVTEQLAGDLLPESQDRDVQNARKIATGFLAMGTKDLNERNLEQYLMDQVDDQIDVTGRAVMGLTVACARCHDHKFDPIPTKDYYALAGIFRSTELLDGYKNRSRGNNGYVQQNRYHKLQLADAELAKPTARQNNNRRGRNRGAQRKAQRLAQIRAEIQKLNRQARAAGNRRPPARIRSRLNQLRKEQRRLNRNGGGASRIRGDEAMGVRDGKVADTQLRVRGEPGNRGGRIPRGFLSAVELAGTPRIGADESGRLQLAQWLTHPDHPLTARVFVNRVWHHLFGRGLVRTVDNFGISGEKPSHPELLDHLALRFVAGGWSVKKLIREVVLSRTYGLSSHKHKANFEVDPDDILLWRMRPKRLEIEAMRDAMMAVSGTLSLARPKGSPVLSVPQGEMGRRGPIAPGAFARHRTMYLPVVRNAVPEALMTFDFAEPCTVTGKRDDTTVATQALFLMNSPFVIAQSQKAADRLAKTDLEDDAARVDAAYQVALGRPATPTEVRRVQKYVADFDSDKSTRDAWASVFQALFASAEFRYVR